MGAEGVPVGECCVNGSVGAVEVEARYDRDNIMIAAEVLW